MDSSEDPAMSVSRQRRFLVLMSLAVIGFYALEVGVKNEAGYSGLVLTLGKPDRAVNALWLIWAWSIWRYGQFVYDTWNIVKSDLTKAIHSEIELLALSAGRREAQNDADNEPGGDDREDIAIANDFAIVYRPADGSKEVNYPGYDQLPHGGRMYRFHGRYVWTKKDATAGGAVFESEMVWSKWRCRRKIIRSWARSSVRRPAISQHILPFAIAAIAAASPSFPW